MRGKMEKRRKRKRVIVVREDGAHFHKRKKQIYNLMYIRRAPNPLNTVRKTPFPPIIMLDARHSLFKTKGKTS